MTRSDSNSKHWFTTSFLQPLPYLFTPQVPENCQPTSSAQTVASLLQTIQTISDVCFITDHVAYASSNKTKIIRIETDFLIFFKTWGGCVSCLRACLDARLLPQAYQYPNLSEGADHVGGQPRGDKQCPFSGVTKSGRVWRKVPESVDPTVGCSIKRLKRWLYEFSICLSLAQAK